MGRLWTGQSVRGRRYQLDGGLSRRGWAAFVLPLQLCKHDSGGLHLVFGGSVARSARLVANMASRVRFPIGRAEWASDQRAVAPQPHRRGAHNRLQPTVLHCAAFSHQCFAVQQSPHVWTRTFASGTTAVFDGGSGQGTIRWAHGKTQVGLPYTNASVARLVAEQGCRWEDV